MSQIIAQKTIKETGKLINITKVHKNLGTHDGDVCDLYQYKENGLNRLIEAPLVSK